MPRVKRQIIQYGSLLFRPMYISAIYSTGLNVESKELKKYINLRIDKKAMIKESSYIRDFEINK
ncbi:MAG TPA: hypothetical protein VN703_03925 [Candidatus Sulfopaludibacter sp.]|nr:hypothetical protein [Candidatus Sulfopaludibacter sp.]